MISSYLGDMKIHFKEDMHSRELPREVQEKFIYSGYRHIESGFIATVISLWRSHNETINIWSHILALFYFFYYFMDPNLLAIVEMIPSEHRLPLYIYFLGVCLLFLASSGAHLLNSISMTWRNVCFMIDYSAISVYGSFAAIYYYYYHNQRITDVITSRGWFFLVTVLLTAIFASWASCHTRLRHTSLCHHIRTSAFTMPFVLGNFPVLIRFTTHLWNNYTTFFAPASLKTMALYADAGWYFEDSDHSLMQDSIIAQSDISLASSVDLSISNIAQSATTPLILTEDGFCRAYMRHLIYLAAAAVVNVVKVPERWYPGCFDIVAHSHQWFHVLIFLGIREQFWLIMHDLKAQYGDPTNHDDLLQDAPSLFWVTVLYMLLICVLAFILTWYGRAIHAKEKAKGK